MSGCGCVSIEFYLLKNHAVNRTGQCAAACEPLEEIPKELCNTQISLNLELFQRENSGPEMLNDIPQATNHESDRVEARSQVSWL